MEPLYSVKTALTEEEFVRFNRYVAHSNKKSSAIIIVGGLLILAFAINQFIKGSDVPLSVGMLAGMLLFIWMYTIGIDFTAKRYYRQYVVKEGGSEQTILFFDDHYEQSTSNANANIAYNQLTAIHFTKTNIYLMRSPRVGVVLPLASCPNGLSEFLQSIKKHNNL